MPYGTDAASIHAKSLNQHYVTPAAASTVAGGTAATQAEYKRVVERRAWNGDKPSSTLETAVTSNVSAAESARLRQRAARHEPI